VNVAGRQAGRQAEREGGWGTGLEGGGQREDGWKDGPSDGGRGQKERGGMGENP
jgi:hypothetical protein